MNSVTSLNVDLIFSELLLARHNDFTPDTNVVNKGSIIIEKILINSLKLVNDLSKNKTSSASIKFQVGSGSAPLLSSISALEFMWLFYPGQA